MEENNSGLSTTTLGLLGFGGLGVIYVLARGGWALAHVLQQCK